MLKVHNINHYDFTLKALEFFERQTPYNFYYSLAKYKDGIPHQTLNFKKRNNTHWTKTHETKMKSFDLLIDIDAGGHEDIFYAHKSTKFIVDFFNETHCPYIVRFSGKGFHVVILYRYLAPSRKLNFNSKSKDSVFMFYSRIAKALQEKFTDMIDTTIYDSRRLCKLSYTLALFEDKNYVCYPFATNEEFEEFDLKNYELGFFHKIIKKQGNPLFNDMCGVGNMLDKLGVE